MKLVLVCDDSVEIRLLLVSLLDKMGLRTILASDGREGLSLARCFLPDLVISDINMPDMNGIQMFREVQKNIIYRDIPWIFMSSPDLREEAMRAGCTQFLTKPFSLQELEESVESALSQQVAQRIH